MTLLFIVDTDPEVSHRPAEAVRIAAGIGAWKSLTLQIVLRDTAAKMLNETADHLVDRDHFSQYLPLLEELGHAIYVESSATGWVDPPNTLASFSETDPADLARLSSEATYLLHF